MDLSIKEVPIDKDVAVGDWVVMRRMNMVQNEYRLTQVVDVSEKVILTTAGLRFSRDGWRFEVKAKYNHRLLKATPELVRYIHRQTLLEQLQSITWQLESTMTLESVMAAYNANKGLIDDE